MADVAWLNLDNLLERRDRLVTGIARPGEGQPWDTKFVREVALPVLLLDTLLLIAKSLKERKKE